MNDTPKIDPSAFAKCRLDKTRPRGSPHPVYVAYILVGNLPADVRSDLLRQYPDLAERLDGADQQPIPLGTAQVVDHDSYGQPVFGPPDMTVHQLARAIRQNLAPRLEREPLEKEMAEAVVKQRAEEQAKRQEAVERLRSLQRAEIEKQKTPVERLEARLASVEEQITELRSLIKG